MASEREMSTQPIPSRSMAHFTFTFTFTNQMRDSGRKKNEESVAAVEELIVSKVKRKSQPRSPAVDPLFSMSDIETDGSFPLLCIHRHLGLKCLKRCHV